MTPLAAYMESNNMTDAALAELVKRERSTITKLRLGTASPSLGLAIQISEITKGDVPVSAWQKQKDEA